MMDFARDSRGRFATRTNAVSYRYESQVLVKGTWRTIARHTTEEQAERAVRHSRERLFRGLSARYIEIEVDE